MQASQSDKGSNLFGTIALNGFQMMFRCCIQRYKLPYSYLPPWRDSEIVGIGHLLSDFSVVDDFASNDDASVVEIIEQLSVAQTIGQFDHFMVLPIA